MVNKRGRPPAGSDARQRLLDAARSRLDAGDLDAASTRELAAAAGVSHSLVNYHFGGRSGLVAAAIALRISPHEVIAVSTDDRGVLDLERLARAFVEVWESPATREPLVAFAREAASGSARSGVFVEYLQHSVFDALASAIGVAQARRVAVAVVGVVFGRYVLRLPAMASLTRAQLAELIRSMLPRTRG
jgi:AcrR family transcriptional regulator